MSYKTYLGVLIVSALGTFWLTPLASWLAFRIGAVDIPNDRKVHFQPMPRLGGVAVFLGFLLPWIPLFFLNNTIAQNFIQHDMRLFLGLVLGASAMLALGTYDDIRGADASKKFIAQVAIAIGLWFFDFKITSIQFPFFDSPLLLGWFGLPVTILWIVGITNAVNLLDGIDGLVAGVTACLALSLAVINILSQSFHGHDSHVMVSLLMLALAGACLGFLPHNHAPARIFLGDSGSLTIGVLLACTGIVSFLSDQHHGAQALNTANALITTNALITNKALVTSNGLITVPLILFALPLFDTARVMYHRWSRGISIFQADKNHIHHRLLAMGLSHRQAAWTLYSVAAVSGLLSILLVSMPIGVQPIVSAVFAAFAVAFAIVWRVRLRHYFMANEDSATATAAGKPSSKAKVDSRINPA